MNARLYPLLLVMALLPIAAQAQVTPTSQMERLDRGVVAIPTSSANVNFITWRLLGTEDKDATTFDVLRNGETIASNLSKTNYQDWKGSATAQYQIVTKVNGEEKETSKAVTPWGGKYLTLKLDQPAKGTEGGTYRPNDMSVGDVDGDGEYELFVKWDPTTSHDNSEDGYTDIVYIDCYKLDGTKLWRVDLGKNIRAGAHYTQFMVYDFDGDGRAEMMCKTATGSKDGKGNYVNQAATDAAIKEHDNQTDYREKSGSHIGHVLSGPEYLTVFNGQTGEAIHTTWYLPGRAGTGSKLPSGNASTEGGSELGKVSTFPKGFWGDNYGGRSERYLAAVAYVNGADQHPCGIFSRGYYSQAYVWAVSFDGTRLHTEWLHASPNGTQSVVFSPKGTTSVKIEVDGDVLVRGGLKTAAANTAGVVSTDGTQNVGSNTLFGNGNHNLSIADVDGDGCDEIIWGAATLDNDGTMLYATGYGHGDAIHVGKMIPDSTDLYVFDVHEEKLKSPHGSWDLHNARTGYIVHHGGPAESDNGRGMAAALSTSYRGYEFWSSDDRQPRLASSGSTVINKSCSVNFRIYWDGTYVDQLFDGSYDKDNDKASPFIQKWNGSSFTNVISFGSETYNNPQTCNTTKATPCLQADILGDWREELVMWNHSDPSEIMIFTTWTATNYMVPTLMHDHTYRMGVAWQNTAYNQPPHLGYYLPDYIEGKLPSAISQANAQPQQTTETFDLQGRRTTGLKKGLNILRVRTDKGIETQKVIY